ncbi:RRM-3 domain-containing protein [Mycena chlorophos]|uniref:RRM-3 domain-containing protein n=1 Tax=Mycena chlorophos TaxID=658473 RepID=A0A8H6VYZ3_MYCCL|nr:RRM-3 domain-containing protein [Mycena chlorophos]
MDDVPSEILQEIFEHFIPGYPKSSPMEIHCSGAPFDLDVYEGAKGITPTTTAKYVQHAKEWLSRSAGLPLSVVLDCGDKIASEEYLFLAQFEGFALLSEHRDRWQFANIMLPIPPNDAPRPWIIGSTWTAPEPSSSKTSGSPCPDTDIPLLLALSLSKYRLWADPELRMDIERCTRVRANEDFFPLSYILDPPSPLSSAELSEAQVAKALRTHGADCVDLRMTIPSAEHKRKAGSYEIRPRFSGWADGEEGEGYASTKAGWDERTVYVTLASAYRFIVGLLSLPQDYTRIQHIASPSPESDEDRLKLKSFALITFKNLEDARALVDSWPWNRRKTRASQAVVDEDTKDALQFGFRVCSKARWEELNAEYLAYQRELAVNEERPQAQTIVSPSPAIAPVPLPTHEHHPPSFPPNCLVCVRNLDPGTNKTALPLAKGLIMCNVNYTKGVDSCHLRLTLPVYADALVKHFADAEGGVRAGHVTDKLEEMYWEKVPEKVRAQAVKRLLDGEDELSEAGAQADDSATLARE